jgi:glycosyltransferase involved in cell wall biosynthesis
MKKILFIHHAKGWGGAPNSMIKLINSLDKKAFDIEVLLLKKSIVTDKLEENEIKYHIAKSWFYKKYYNYFTHSEAGYLKCYHIYPFFKKLFFWLMSRYYFAAKELLRFEFDICHLNSSVLSDWLNPCSKKGKVVIQIREPFRKGRYDILHPFFTGQMRKYADRIIAISHDNANRIGVPEKTEVIYNFAGIPENAPAENSYHSKKVLYLGGAAYIKGFFTMVEALDYLDKDVKVYFGGNYNSSTKKHNVIKKMLKIILGVGKKKKSAIKKMRNHPNAVEIGMSNNISKYLNEVCCLVSPFSVPHFSRPVIEAHIHKKPVIGSDVEGMDEIIKHGENGLIVKKNDPKELASAINLLTHDIKNAKKFGEEGYHKGKQKFSEKNIRKLQNIYNKLL